MDTKTCQFSVDNGKSCRRFTWSQQPCRHAGMNLDDYDHPVGLIPIDDVCQNVSIYGNEFYFITPEQIDELLAGKVIHLDDGEYTNFIALKGEKK